MCTPEDLVLHLHRVDAGLEVGLHLVLVARVGVDDVPLAGTAERIVGRLLRWSGLRGHGDLGLGLRGALDLRLRLGGDRLGGDRVGDELLANLVGDLLDGSGLDDALSQHLVLGGVAGGLDDEGLGEALLDHGLGRLILACGLELVGELRGLFERLLRGGVGHLLDNDGLGDRLDQDLLFDLVGLALQLGGVGERVGDGCRLDGRRLVGGRLVGGRLVGGRLVGGRLVGRRLVGRRLVGVAVGGRGGSGFFDHSGILHGV